MSQTLLTSRPLPFAVSVGLSHYEGPATTWHVQVELTRLDDPTFASPQLQGDTSVSQTGWYYRDERLDATDMGLQAFPSGGVAADPNQVRAHNRFATARLLVTSDSDLALFRPRENLLARARQSADGGSSWGDWVDLGVVQVGG